ncbi:hypothetical protein HY375_02360 [Candidatus Berkelbacteria bacterium]|nr:hypothetical protein [Candidatus Berkelbacteria bacterium]
MKRLKYAGRLGVICMITAAVFVLAFLGLEFLVIDPMFVVDYPELLDWEALEAKHAYQRVVTDALVNTMFAGVFMTLGLVMWRLGIAYGELRAGKPLTP